MSEMEVNREEWLRNACAGFVTPGTANRNYYRLILETLWPSGYSIPGPVVSKEKLRQAIDDFRRNQSQGKEPYKNYLDVHRRLRELQGEEGFLGINKLGHNYQLISLEISPKREPRIKLSDDLWERVLSAYQHRCSVCGRQKPIVKLEHDHKIPRLRGGGNEEENWQPLCGECNNFKSTSCRGCNLDCNQCAWAFPEKFAPIKMSSSDIQRVKELALQKGVRSDSLLSEIIEHYFQTIS